LEDETIVVSFEQAQVTCTQEGATPALRTGHFTERDAAGSIWQMLLAIRRLEDEEKYPACWGCPRLFAKLVFK